MPEASEAQSILKFGETELRFRRRTATNLNYETICTSVYLYLYLKLDIQVKFNQIFLCYMLLGEDVIASTENQLKPHHLPFIKNLLHNKITLSPNTQPQ